MVIVRLIGGLGNQLFQYAAGRAIAQRHNVPLKLDTSRFEGTPQRKYALDNFRISASLATASEVRHLTGSNGNRARRRLTKFYQGYLPYYRQSVFVERGFQFDPNFFRARREVYLIGYWQSEKYFRDISEVLETEFAVRNELHGLNAVMVERVRAESASVSVHVRRGDYATDPTIRGVHGTCSLDYYQGAVAKLVSLGIQPRLFVFSDDISWARANLHFDYPITFVDHNNEGAACEDLRLMSLCKHHIIANSSFSWWGAWLSKNPTKTVIAPRRWFNNAGHDTRDLIPSSWIQL